jgi:hypothetical protein
MPFCNTCGGENPEHAKFCGHCGARQTGLDDPTFTSGSTSSQPAPIPLSFEAEVASFREDLSSLLETLKVHEKVEYLLNEFMDVAVEFSILGGRVPSEKIRLFWDIFALMDPTIADMDLQIVGRYIKTYLTGPGARVPGVIQEPICLDSLKAADEDERTNHAEQCACLLYRLADLVCRADGRIDSNERAALAKLRTIVEATRPTWTVPNWAEIKKTADEIADLIKQIGPIVQANFNASGLADDRSSVEESILFDFKKFAQLVSTANWQASVEDAVVYLGIFRRLEPGEYELLKPDNFVNLLGDFGASARDLFTKFPKPSVLTTLEEHDKQYGTGYAHQYVDVATRVVHLFESTDNRADPKKSEWAMRVLQALQPREIEPQSGGEAPKSAKLHTALGTFGADQAGPIGSSDSVAEVDAFKRERPSAIDTHKAPFRTAVEITFSAAEEDFASPYVQLSSITAKRLDKDYEVNRYSNSVLILPVFTNVGSGTIVGLRGHLSVLDGFGEEVFGFNFRADDKLLPGHDSDRSGGYCFEENQYEDDNPYLKIVPLIDAGTAKYTVRITKIAFEDGTILPKN